MKWNFKTTSLNVVVKDRGTFGSIHHVLDIHHETTTRILSMKHGSNMERKPRDANGRFETALQLKHFLHKNKPPLIGAGIWKNL